ncbi:TPA: histidine phosphatase family protein [Candidatus Woesearchaeota archaeon]|nr:hypothetical protein [uncultured archaeon]MBS3173020.1 histidine phosphatase family protein [Candidatus Woesearchaeota archaeon]AQS32929.1 hypothetical protein [uncultured archaeon]HIH31890.1 histidine phosphatase family protein [Candidatus Woesearchaeota archaeon]HIH54359.1 histidine phosphatase family protein [Candidatus Woesearchaeota archaeon]
MKTRLIIVRHGETDSNKEGRLDGQHETMLTPNGIKQANALSERLSKEEINLIVSSPLKRAQDTANIIRKHHKLEIKTIPEFIEIDCGICTLMKRDEVITKYPELHKGWINLTDPKFPRGENLKDVEKRAIPKLKEIINKNMGKTILLVGHGSLNIGIIGHYLRIPYGLRFKIGQGNCCINELVIEDDDFSIKKINYIPY